MNRYIFYILILSFLGSCGVKGPPSAPPGTEITPWIQSYMKDVPPNPKPTLQNESEEQENRGRGF